jgi:UDP-glucose 4-epimerase
MTKPICVATGSEGFIGKHLVKHLENAGYHVRGFDIKSDPDGQDIRRCHLGLREAMDGATCVFHLAGLADIVPSIEKPVDYFSTNVQGTIHVLEAARAAGVKKFVYAASSSCYGDKSIGVPSRESASIQPQYPYALSKWMGEVACRHWHHVYGMPINSLRLFNVYGRGQKTSGAYGSVMGTFLRQKLAGAPLTIVGDGSQLRDFVHVSDVCEAFRLAAESEFSGLVWNVGTENPQSISHLASLIGGGCTHIPHRPGEPDVTCADIDAIKLALGWSPKMSFEDGIADMLEHIEEWRDAPLWTPESIAEATKSWMEALNGN